MKFSTQTINFIPLSHVLKGRKVTYDHIVKKILPHKEDMHRAYLKIGGNLINHPGDVRTPTSNRMTKKLPLNSTILSEGARFIAYNVRKLYLNTPLKSYDYMRIHINLIPDNIINQYNLCPLMHNMYVYIKIRRGVYGLYQAGLLANQHLMKHLTKFGY